MMHNWQKNKVIIMINDELKGILQDKKKILIIGPNGAGKSTVAAKLGEQFKMKVYHLDKIYWKENWKSIDEQEFNRKVDDIMLSDIACIIDGGYCSNLERRLKYADLIIWLQVPLFICIFNIIKRRFKNINSVRPDMADGCKEKLSFSFFIYALKYNQRSGRKTRRLIDNAYHKEVLIINKYRMLRKLLKS
ncbi:AAA family ATPase [Melissococcus plutonius]|uniref:AAA family ATPase n=1 Tax=Melissococcus plutonius TaxID=33970 RepID=UPI001E3169BF|nr:AAA family ATPase [Melissococcus plutonius]